MTVKHTTLLCRSNIKAFLYKTKDDEIQKKKNGKLRQVTPNLFLKFINNSERFFFTCKKKVRTNIVEKFLY